MTSVLDLVHFDSLLEGVDLQDYRGEGRMDWAVWPVKGAKRNRKAPQERGIPVARHRGR
ncbi:MAG: hypothetical protein ACLR0U_28650 [Enterocloster clostridioformis]